MSPALRARFWVAVCVCNLISIALSVVALAVLR